MSNSKTNHRVRSRAASIEDKRWIWALYSELLKPAIDRQWGWCETTQKLNFDEHLPLTLFSVIEVGDNPVAAWALREHTTHLYLHLLLVTPMYQLRGIGTDIINRVKTSAISAGKPIELSTFPANPVDAFYVRNGFRLIDATADKNRYRWNPSPTDTKVSTGLPLSES